LTSFREKSKAKFWSSKRK